MPPLFQAIAPARAYRRHDQQRRADVTVATRSPQDRRVGLDVRREYQGRAVRHRRGAAAYEAAKSRAHHNTMTLN